MIVANQRITVHAARNAVCPKDRRPSIPYPIDAPNTIKVEQTGQAEQGDQRREQGEEPVVRQASRAHAAAVADEFLPCALQGVTPGESRGLKSGSRIGRPPTLLRDRFRAVGWQALGGIRLGHDHAPKIKLPMFITLPDHGRLLDTGQARHAACRCGPPQHGLSGLRLPPVVLVAPSHRCDF
jgi:hypothetical protein